MVLQRQDFQNKRGDHSEANSTHQKKGVIFRAHFIHCFMLFFFFFFLSWANAFKNWVAICYLFSHKHHHYYLFLRFCFTTAKVPWDGQKNGREAICLFLFMTLFASLQKLRREEREAYEGSDLLHRQADVLITIVNSIQHITLQHNSTLTDHSMKQSRWLNEYKANQIRSPIKFPINRQTVIYPGLLLRGVFLLEFHCRG